jgi:DNA repair exonuclease SbcCD nuclease subunit
MKKLKTNKIGVFSDIHIGLSQDNPMWHEIILNFGKWASEKYENLGISEIFIPGDIFHNRSEISVKTLDVAKKFFDMFKNFDLYISVGNHDVYKKNSSDIHSLQLLSEWKNINIIDTTPEIYKTPKGKTVSLIPWATEIENIPESDFCFGHFDIQSFYMNGYKICEHGFESKNLFSKSKFIISGHFHKKDFREYTDGTIMYLGSPYQQNFGDIGDERGIYVFDLEKNSFDFYLNEVSPKHIKIKISEIVDKKIKIEDIKNIIPNNLICLIIDKNLSPDLYSILFSKIQNLNPKFLKTEYNQINDEKNLEIVENLEISDISKIIEEYIEAMDVKNKEDLKKYIGDIYEKFK